MEEQPNIAQPLVSFVITDYNIPAAYLHECVESILSLNLSPEEREIILIDDGSDVSPLPELGELADKVIYHRQENQGLSVARNTGIDIAKGLYIQFVDGDDKLLVSGYNQVLAQARKETYDLVMFSFSHTNVENKSMAERMNLFMATYGDVFLKQHNLRPAAWGYIVKKEKIGDLRFTPGIFHEDEEFTPILLANCSFIAHTKIRAYYYRQRSGSITNETNRDHIDKRLRDFFGIMLRLREQTNKGKEYKCITRRVNQLSMDFIYNSILLTKDAESLENSISLMRKYKLFPLPFHKYTWKYMLFCLVSRFHFGRKLIFKYIVK